MEGTISLEKKGMVFFAVPYDKGWSVSVDGKKVKTIAVGNAFLAVEASEGNHKIVLKYLPSGFKEGMVLSVVGFVIFLYLCYHSRKKKISKL